MSNTEFDPQRCGDRVLALARNAERLTIIAPFITVAGLRPILAALPHSSALEIFTRWRPDEVAQGVSDPEIFTLVDERGGIVSLHPFVHAKAYITETSALVGSANVTVNGLGWNRPGAVELLVEPAAKDFALASLVETLRLTSAKATEADRDAVIAAAQMLHHPQASPRSESGTSNDWLPMYRPPEVLWRVYAGQREESVADLVRPDLAALGVPNGLTTETAFDRYVGAIIRQGFTGLIARECSGLTTVKAVERLVGLCATTGRSLEDPADSWETLVMWMAHFVPNYYRIWGGSRLVG